ncbi:MAG: hypothetical protein PF483_03320 [Halothiobacillus sp.]|nr:hypothetical protein [Halothiobacillus sp.]
MGRAKLLGKFRAELCIVEFAQQGLDKGISTQNFALEIVDEGLAVLIAQKAIGLPLPRAMM